GLLIPSALGKMGRAIPILTQSGPNRPRYRDWIETTMGSLPPKPLPMPRKRLVWPVMALLALGAMAAALLPRWYDAGFLLLAQDDPVKLADHAVAERLNPAVAEREIEAALAAGDVDLANSFVELAAERGMAIRPELVARLASAN